jgi:hypothetical protein
MMAICVVQGRTLLNHVLGLQFPIRYKFSHSAKIYANRCNIFVAGFPGHTNVGQQYNNKMAQHHFLPSYLDVANAISDFPLL